MPWSVETVAAAALRAAWQLRSNCCLRRWGLTCSGVSLGLAPAAPAVDQLAIRRQHSHFSAIDAKVTWQGGEIEIQTWFPWAWRRRRRPSIS